MRLSCRSLSVIALYAIALVGFFKVLLRAYYESLGGFHSDASIYMVVARGLLEGLTPYADLFENKAPGVFLLGALSIVIAGGTVFLSWFQAGIIALFPASVALPGLFLTRDIRARLLLLIFGCALTLFVAEEAGQLLPESWGALFSVLFLGVLAVRGARPFWGIGTYATLAALLLITTGIKEPFFLSTIGAALILLRGWKDVRRLLTIALIAGIAGLTGLLLLGQLHAYVTIHLAHMLGFHIFHPWGTVGVPWWIRLNDIPRIIGTLWGFSPSFASGIVLLWAGTLYAILKGNLKQGTRSYTLQVIGFVIATWSNTAAIGFTGDFYPHHFIFAVPLMAACALRLVRAIPYSPQWSNGAIQQSSSLHRARTQEAGCMLLTILFTTTLLGAEWDLRYRQTQWEEWAAPKRRVAAALDTAMDRCGYGRYLNLIDRPEGFYGFPRHLPYGPIFTQYGRFIGALPAYLDAFTDALTVAPVAVMTTRAELVPMESATQQVVLESFTEIPPPCAGEIGKTEPYRILFRAP